MLSEVTERMLRLFERRSNSDPDLSAATVRTLFNEQRAKDFGKDEKILSDLIESFEKEQ